MEPKIDRSMLGIGMVVLGGVLLMGQFGLLSEHIFLYLLGAGFILTYFIFGGKTNYGSIGFLIPGTVLLAISVFADLEEYFHLGGWGFFLCLAGAFLAVFLVHTRNFYSWGEKNWPLFPAAGLTFFSLFIFLVENGKYIVNLFEYVGAGLVLCGVYFIWKGKQQK